MKVISYTPYCIARIAVATCLLSVIYVESQTAAALVCPRVYYLNLFSVDLRVVMEEILGEEVDGVVGPRLHALHQRSAQRRHHVLHQVAAQRLRLQLERREFLVLHLHTHMGMIRFDWS